MEEFRENYYYFLEEVPDDALDDDSDGDDSEHVIVRATPSLDSEARRKLEDALEERRLRKQIQDYDFDFD